jgi:hypothetical protein
MLGSQAKRSVPQRAVIKMEKRLAERVTQMIAALKNWQEILAANGYSESSQLLEICKLDLQLKLHSISDSELSQFCDAVREAHSAATESNLATGKLGPHFNGSEALPVYQNVVIMSEARVASRRKDNSRK